MQENKNILVEIGSHTDSRGSTTSNLSLSERRAKAVVEYMILKGISKERLIAVGHGEDNLWTIVEMVLIVLNPFMLKIEELSLKYFKKNQIKKAGEYSAFFMF